MNYRSIITILASTLDNNGTMRELCPRCEGGSSGEKSLSISRTSEGHIVWQCFRANCPERGGTGDVMRVHRAPVAPAPPRKEFEGSTKALTEYHLAQLERMWGIKDPPYWYWTPEYGGRVAMSIRSPKYTHRGWVLRDIRGASRTKALTYLDKDQEALSWYKVSKDAPTVVVEDIPSAVRVAQAGVNAVALLGTAVGLPKAIEIAKNAPGEIVIALDQDATRKSFEVVQRYGLLFGDSRVLPIPKDFKDMTEEELQEILR